MSDRMIVGATLRHDFGTYGYPFRGGEESKLSFLRQLCVHVLDYKKSIFEYISEFATSTERCGLQPHKYDIYLDAMNNLVYFWENGQWLEFKPEALREYLKKMEVPDADE